MAHESFEDDAIAAYLNEHVVSVKVDREERPDVDAVYMAAVQGMTGRGGWPMSVFLDHDRRPFYAGTYWPKEPRHGSPSFPQVVQAIVDAWTNRRDEVLDSAGEITQALSAADVPTPEDDVDPTLSAAAVDVIVDRAWDRTLGGFGRAPKFPQAMTIGLLLDHHARTGQAPALEAAVHSLRAMARGGIHDHVAGGFARYSTDARWLVPHFEKMLYDNGLLLDVYARAAGLTGDGELARVAHGIARYLVREMQHDAGGFFSATDADSEGLEGKFFVWTDEEFRDVCQQADVDPDTFAAFHGVQPDGNFAAEAAGHAPERANILHEPVPREAFVADHDLDADGFAADLDRLHAALYERRSTRVPPGLDDKILTSWNALAIRGLARAAIHLDEPAYAEAAARAARFLRDHLVVDGRLHHTWKDGTAAVPAFLEDVAGLAAALPWLAAATGDPAWIGWAIELADDARTRFADPDGGPFFQTADDAEELVTRPRETWDNATPSGSSLLASAAWQLALLTGDHGWQDLADQVVRGLASHVRRSPTGFGNFYRSSRHGVRTPARSPSSAHRDRTGTRWLRPRCGDLVRGWSPRWPNPAIPPSTPSRCWPTGRHAMADRRPTCAVGSSATHPRRTRSRSRRRSRRPGSVQPGDGLADPTGDGDHDRAQERCPEEPGGGQPQAGRIGDGNDDLQHERVQHQQEQSQRQDHHRQRQQLEDGLDEGVQHGQHRGDDHQRPPLAFVAQSVNQYDGKPHGGRVDRQPQDDSDHGPLPVRW
jgi:uncharacterized protein